MGPLSRDHDVRMELNRPEHPSEPRLRTVRAQVSPRRSRALNACADGAAGRGIGWNGCRRSRMASIEETKRRLPGAMANRRRRAPQSSGAPDRKAAHTQSRNRARGRSRPRLAWAGFWEAMVEAVGKTPPVGRGSTNLDERRRAAGGESEHGREDQDHHRPGAGVVRQGRRLPGIRCQRHFSGRWAGRRGALAAQDNTPRCVVQTGRHDTDDPGRPARWDCRSRFEHRGDRSLPGKRAPGRGVLVEPRCDYAMADRGAALGDAHGGLRDGPNRPKPTASRRRFRPRRRHARSVAAETTRVARSGTRLRDGSDPTTRWPLRTGVMGAGPGERGCMLARATGRRATVRSKSTRALGGLANGVCRAKAVDAAPPGHDVGSPPACQFGRAVWPNEEGRGESSPVVNATGHPGGH